MADQKNPTPSKKLNPLIIILIVIGGLAVLGFLATTIGGLFLAGKVAKELKKSGIQYDVNKDSVTLKGKKDGESFSVGQGTKLPNDFPKNFPLYPNSSTISVIESEEGFSVTFAVPTEAGALGTWYKSELPKNGWDIKNDGVYGIIEFEDSSFSGTLVIVPQEKQSALTLTLKKAK